MTRGAITFVLALATVLAAAPAVFGVGAAGGGVRPRRPVIEEPAAAGQIVHPADVHMVTAPYFDADGNPHYCTTWQILIASTRRLVWRDWCDKVNKVHVHLGDGIFVGRYAGRIQLKYNVKYILRVRHAQGTSAPSVWSKWREKVFKTSARPPTGTTTAWTLRQSGFALDVVATGLKLPVNMAFVPTPPTTPSDPFFYVTELHGSIKVVARDGSVSDYFSGVLNYPPPLTFPGAGEQGLTGLVVEPVTGDVFASMLYRGSDDQQHPQVVRFHTAHGGAVADGSTVIFQAPNDTSGPAHQISNLSFGPDGLLYVHVGDGFQTAKAQNLDSVLGKILRMNLDGTAAPGNPFYNASNGITARDYVYAYGFRNPFGGDWRPADNQHYMVENGPAVDRLERLVPGQNYLWDGTNQSFNNYALYKWDPATAPVNIAFVASQIQGGSGFPAAKLGHAFVSESGATYANGPQIRGKKVTEFVLDAGGAVVSGPTTLVEYTGTGRATAVGLTAGPDGLYFSELYRDLGATDPTDPGARILRIRWVGP